MSTPGFLGTDLGQEPKECRLVELLYLGEFQPEGWGGSSSGLHHPPRVFTVIVVSSWSVISKGVAHGQRETVQNARPSMLNVLGDAIGDGKFSDHLTRRTQSSSSSSS